MYFMIMSNSENPRSLRENCIHVTNFAVNKENVAKFVHNESPNECVGNKWRLKRLWNYLFENYGMGEPEMDMIWSEVRGTDCLSSHLVVLSH